MKHYVYKSSHYLIQMIIPGVFTMLIGIYCLFQLVFGSHNVLFLFVLFLCTYNVWNLFVSASNPSEIWADDENLVFISLSKVHKYKIGDIHQFAMRVMSGNGRIYMTINHGGFTKGRYWVRTEEFSDGKELTDYFYTLDAKINPKSLFTRARSQGREPVEKRK